ncbi:hypothetical protein NESM_000432300 [Novymonas esmeraldas]|uniref:Uncharacterized protein n=1 Tax=Novymonas esmeraldas TaxID=1808958 RepID=A0AAW0EN57_9TRYP
MFAFELSTASPCRSAPYYSMVIRSPYILGQHAGADITLAYEGISAEHVSMTVMQAREAAREVAAATRAAASAAEAGEPAPEEALADADGDSSGLVVRVTALPTKGEAEVRLGDTPLHAGDSAIVRDGDVLYLGEGVSGTFRYRPLMVGIEAGAYPADYLSDLRRMFGQLGATLVDEPMPAHEAPATPIGQLYCAAELNDSTGCLAALSCGYSVVQSTYVFEWFAAVARRAAAPLNTLPAPSRFEVPVRCTAHPTSTTYLRPESDTCPFSLFPIPHTAMTNRSRAELFAHRVFFFFTDAAATRYWRAVEDCGGAVYGPGDVEAAKEAIHVLVEAQRDAGAAPDRVPNNFYIIIDNTSEAVLLNAGLAAASPELLGFMEEARTTAGATHLPVMGDHSLFTALLSNRFFEEPVPLTVAPPPPATQGYGAAYYDPADTFVVPPLSLSAAAAAAGGGGGASARSPRSGYMNGGANSATARSVSRASERRASLLPRSRGRTPSRSQMRSFSRQRTRSASARGPADQGHDGGLYAGSEYRSASGATSGRYGRRRLVHTVVEGEMRSFTEDFDMLRVRVYAFLVREEPKLDMAITAYHKNYFVTSDTMEYALEVKAQAVNFMESADDLLADAACHGAYMTSLRRFWRDCSDMDMKAQHLLHCWDRSMPAAALPRRSRSRRASSAASRRAVSPRSVTPRGAAHAASSPAPAARSAEPATPGGVGVDEHAADTYSPAPHPHDSESAREHRDLYTSPEASQRLHAGGRIPESAITAEEVAATLGHNGAGPMSSATTPRGTIATSRYSQRRSYAPSHSRSRSAAAAASLPRQVPIAERPPWVSTWSDGAESERQSPPPPASRKHKQRPAAADAKPSAPAPAPTPEPAPTMYPMPRIRPAAPQPEFAGDSPRVVRARSAGRSSSSPAHRPPPPQPRPEPSDTHGDDDTAVSAPPQHADPESQIHTAPAPAEAAESDADEESQVRTAPAPVPAPAPAPQKAAQLLPPSPTAPRHVKAPGSKTGSRLTSASKRTGSPAASHRTNGSAAAVNGNGHSRPQRTCVTGSA